MRLSDWDDLTSVLPTYAREDGSTHGCYLPLLNLHVGATQCFKEYAEIASHRDDLEEKIVRLFDASPGGWRAHLPASAYILIIGLTNETQRALWDAIDRGSWVCPQLTVVAYLKDDRFIDSARQRIEAAARGETSTPAKAISSLLYLCRRISSTMTWLGDLEKAEPLKRYLIENDHDRGYRFARHWLYGLKHRVNLDIAEPGGKTAFDLCRARDFTELLGTLSEEQVTTFFHWSMRIALRKVAGVVSAHDSNEARLNGLASIEHWLSEATIPSQAIRDAVAQVVIETHPPNRVSHGQFVFSADSAMIEGSFGEFAYAASSAIHHLMKAPEADSFQSQIVHSIRPAIELSIAASGDVKAEQFPKVFTHSGHAPSEYVSSIVERLLCRGMYVISRRTIA